MVSSFRCNEVKMDSLNKSIRNFNKLRKKLKSNASVDLRKEYKRIMDESVKKFEDDTTYYDDEIVNENKDELVKKI